MAKEKLYFSVYKNIEDRLEYIWKSYKEKVNLYYQDIYELHNEYFRLYSGIKFIYVPIEFDDLIGIAYVMKGSYEGLVIEERELPKDFFSSSIGREQTVIVNKITEIVGIKEDELYSKEPLSLSNLTTLRFDSSDYGTGQYFAQQEYELFNKDRHENIGYHTKDFISVPDLPISISKYGPLLDKVNDDNFKSELHEAFLCFKNELFLSSALVVGRLIETALKLLIIKSLGKEKFYNIPSNKRVIGKFTDVLEENEIINGSEKNSIISAAMIRNSISHSTGKTDFKAKIHIMFSELVMICEKIPD
ncbi:Uncharacterized protein BCZB5J_06493 [Bacillus cereus]|nr:hypothetical protein [Bacillus cereus]SCC69936.1 Uncharacterized protein BCZB5J_06493 [Bacillus cereus]